MKNPSEGAEGSPGSALRLLAESELTEAQADLGRKGGHLHKGVHLARKSIRRTRSLLKLAAGQLGPGADALSFLLSRTNQGLSRLRDAQALVEAIDNFGASTSNEKRLRLLSRARKSALVARRGVLKDAMIEDPEFSHARAMLAEIRRALPDLSWSELTAKQLQESFARSKKQTRKAAEKAAASGMDEDWHAWRRKARRQSQQHRLLDQAGVESHAGHDDKHIAELLGKQQDCSLLLEFCESARSPIGWADRNQLATYIKKQLRTSRKRLATHS